MALKAQVPTGALSEQSPTLRASQTFREQNSYPSIWYGVPRPPLRNTLLDPESPFLSPLADTPYRLAPGAAELRVA